MFCGNLYSDFLGPCICSRFSIRVFRFAFFDLRFWNLRFSISVFLISMWKNFVVTYTRRRISATSGDFRQKSLIPCTSSLYLTDVKDQNYPTESLAGNREKQLNFSDIFNFTTKIKGCCHKYHCGYQPFPHLSFSKMGQCLLVLDT